jgi:hypothetical protein
MHIRRANASICRRNRVCAPLTLVSRPAAEHDHAQRSGTDLASYDRSILLGVVFTAALALVAAASFLRRDVTT